MSATLFEIGPADWVQLRRLLDEAMDLPAAARAAWLSALPAEHAPLRPRLESLLAHADDSVAPAGSPATGRFGSLPRLAPVSDGPPPLPPDTGPYRAIRLLGEGGMGRVWLAERTDMLQGRPVALKLPHAFSRHPDLARRMAQEREILAVLDHPNIARIYDAGVTPDGQPWLALEYVEGQRIDAYAAQHDLDVRQRITLFRQVCAAVAHAHARLVVHRDLKPGNILVTDGSRSGDLSASGGPVHGLAGGGVVRLLDFGIAKLLAPGDATQAELTAPAQRALTPLYAAPEQILGQPIGTAADIYSLGVVLYELLTGELPYRPKRATPAAMEETILDAAPPRPSQRATDPDARRALAGDLDTVLLKALKKDPAERYATVQAFSDDLGNWLARRPVSAQPDRPWYHARRFVQRNALAVSLAAGFVLSLGGALGVALWQAGEARQQAAKAGAITDFLVGLFRANDIEQADGHAKREQSVQQLLEHSADALVGGLADQPELRGELQKVVGGLLNDLEITGAAIRVRSARVDALARAGAWPVEQAQALRELAESHRALSEWDTARMRLNQALAMCGKSQAPACLGAALDLSIVDFAQRRTADAAGRLEPLLPTLQRVAPASADRAQALETLAGLRALANRPDDAMTLFQQALELRRVQWGAGSVRLAQMRFRFGRTLWHQRRLAHARAELQEAWRITRDALGPAHVSAARIELNLGRLLAYAGEGSKGLEHLRHAHAVLLQQQDRIDPVEAFHAQVVWGNALLVDGHLAEARAPLDDALARRQQLGERAGPDPTLDVSDARWLSDTGRFAQALQAGARLRDTTIQAVGPQHPDVADRRVRLAQALMAAGELNTAAAELAAAMSTQNAAETVFGSPKHRAQLAQAALHLEQGRIDEAAGLVDTLVHLAAKTPREDQYRDLAVQLDEVVARTWAAQGRHAQARPHFERAIATLAAANPLHPWAAAARGHFAASLAADGDTRAARQQVQLARAALAAQPLAGPQHARPVLEAERRIEGR